MATNILGQNTSAIAATEMQYADMWAQDAAAMYGYAGQSAAAAQVTPFTTPPQTTNPGGLASQSTGIAQATGPSAGAQSTLSQLMSRVPSSLRSLATPAAAAPATSPAQGLSGIIAPGTPLTTLLETYELAGPALLPIRNVLVTATSGMALGARGFQTGALPVAAAAASPLGAGLGSAGSAGLAGAASAGVGDAVQWARCRSRRAGLRPLRRSGSPPPRYRAWGRPAPLWLRQPPREPCSVRWLWRAWPVVR